MSYSQVPGAGTWIYLFEGHNSTQNKDTSCSALGFLIQQDQPDRCYHNTEHPKLSKITFVYWVKCDLIPRKSSQCIAINTNSAPVVGSWHALPTYLRPSWSFPLSVSASPLPEVCRVQHLIAFYNLLLPIAPSVSNLFLSFFPHIQLPHLCIILKDCVKWWESFWQLFIF